MVALAAAERPAAAFIRVHSVGAVHKSGVSPMAWFALARGLFIVTVAYAAVILQPLPVGILLNVTFALCLAALVVLFESRLRDIPITRVLGALIGCGVGLAIAHGIGTGLF